MIFSTRKPVQIHYIPNQRSHYGDMFEIKYYYSKFWLGESLILKSKSYATNIHVCCYKGDGKFDIEDDIIKFSGNWSIKISVYYEFNDSDFIWLRFQTGSEERKFALNPTYRINISYRSFGTDLYIIAWDCYECINTPNKIYDFIGGTKQMTETIEHYLQSPREDLEFVCDTDIPGFDMHKTLGGYEIACTDVDYMKVFIIDNNHPVIINSNKCTIAADRLIDDHRYNMIYISPTFRNHIIFDQETLLDKIFVKVIKENNVLNVILSADPDSFIEPSIDQYEKFVDPKKLIKINVLCFFDPSKYLKVDSITLKSVKYSITDSNIKKIQFRKPGFMKYTIPVKPHSTIMISTKRYSDTEVFLTASINGVPQSFMQRLDKETTNVDIRIDCKKDIIKFILL